VSTLIIGGTGFIGARLTERLVSRGENVVCFDLYPAPQKVSHLGDRAKVIVGDITRIEDVIGAIREFGVERIVNLAYMLGTESEASPHVALRVNVMGMNNVFEAARLTGINRVVYASSIAVYGVQSSFGERPLVETDFCQPTLVYGAHKLWNEFMAGKYMERYAMSIPALRIAVVGGPGRKTGLSAWASTYVDGPALGKPAEIPFRSDQKTLITYVEDAAEMFTRLLFSEKPGHHVYNSCAYAATLGELGETVRSFFPDADIRFNEKASEQPLVYTWSSERLETEFGMKLPPLKEMVRRHINETRKGAGLSGI
jgi:nucleoside-diphosphate-sugar epimerase